MKWHVWSCRMLHHPSTRYVFSSLLQPQTNEILRSITISTCIHFLFFGSYFYFYFFLAISHGSSLWWFFFLYIFYLLQTAEVAPSDSVHNDQENEKNHMSRWAANQYFNLKILSTEPTTTVFHIELYYTNMSTHIKVVPERLWQHK